MKLLNHSLFPSDESRSPLTPERVQYGALIAAGLLEAVLIVFNYKVRDRIEVYQIIAPLVFVGATLGANKTPAARRNLLLGIVCVLWFCVAQEIHLSREGDCRSLNLFAPAYLMAFPFASAYADGERQRGLRSFRWIYLAAVLAMCLGGLALVLKILPDDNFLGYYWDGDRFRPGWHPNITACLLMIIIAICLGQFYRAERLWAKGVYLLLIAGILFFQALTNSRTAVLLTDALIGGSVILSQWGKGWKRILLGFVAAAVLAAGLYVAATGLYKANVAALQADYYAQQAAAAEDDASVAEETASAEDSAASAEEAAVTQSDELPTSGDRSLLADLGTLNGRTDTWAGAIAALKDNPRILVFGVHYVGETVSFYKTPGSLIVEHTHNSYLEILFWLGLPGLAMALYFTFLVLRAAVRLLFGSAPMDRKCAVLLCLCLLGGGMLEPLLFTGESQYFFINFYFFLCLGYVNQWAIEASPQK